jgi:alpha-1,3-glucan synthase
VAPLIIEALSLWIYTRSFYKIKFNKIGVTQKLGLLGLLPSSAQKHFTTKPREEKLSMLGKMKRSSQVFSTSISKAEAMVVLSLPETRRTVLIATMEYDIEDWAIKIKIGGLGVMAQLMGKNLEHQDLIWVVPCAGGIEYPQDEVAKPMTVAVLGKTYEVNVRKCNRGTRGELSRSGLTASRRIPQVTQHYLRPTRCPNLPATNRRRALSGPNGRSRLGYLLLRMESMHCPSTRAFRGRSISY